ncbi:hypothetical protein UPYG_G00285160 [Umbra pygmaea]|uniref:Phospholipase A2-like central domain-containing protein n=1 Tax=Umbra pygmaea TaxID=75934 RepID=A0ABD0W3V1_UMBPY
MLNGETHLSFLRHDSEPLHSSSFLRLYYSVWSGENTLLNCAVSEDIGVTDDYSFLCREKSITENFSDSPGKRFDVSPLFGLESSCASFSSPTVTKRLDFGEALEEVKMTRKNWTETIFFSDKYADEARTFQDRKGESFRNFTHAHRRVKRGFIVPGTLWCGSGSKAENYEDLENRSGAGVFAQTDSCCREHDQCQDTILSFESNYGVFNKNIFTLSHCDCDTRFRMCLLGAEDSISDVVGYTFFNLLNMPCFEFSQKLQCSQRNWFGMCLQYDMALYAVIHSATQYNSTQRETLLGQMEQPVDHTTTSTYSYTSSSPFISTSNIPSSSITSSTFITYSSSPSNSPSTSPSLPPSSSTSISDSSADAADLTAGGQSVTLDPGSLIADADGADNMSEHTSSTPAYTPDTAAGPRTQSSSSTPVTASISGPALDSQSKPSHQHGHHHQTEQNKASKGKHHVHMCDAYRHLDDCSFQIPPHQEKYGLLNPEPRSIYHCDCTSRLFDGLDQYKEWSGVKTVLLQYISQSCFTFQPQDCTQQTSCSAVLVQPSPTQLEWQQRTGGDSRRSSRRDVSILAKRKGRWFRLQKLCFRMAQPKIYRTRKHKHCASIDDGVPM